MKNCLMQILGTMVLAASLSPTAVLAGESAAERKIEGYILSTFAAPQAAGKSANRLIGEAEIVDSETREDGKVIVYAAMDREFLDQKFNAEIMEQMTWALGGIFKSLDKRPDLSVLVRYKNDPSSEYKDLLEYLPPAPPQLQKPEPAKAAKSAEGGQPPFAGQEHPDGFLAGKSVFLAPGHGWYYSTNAGRWATQRGLSQGIIEDHANIDFAINYLVPYLQNAGANVYTTRERDMNTNLVIIDNGEAGYSETGSWSDSTGGYGSGQRVTPASSTETATATFTPTIPEAGHYEVYVWYQPVDNAATAAKFTVNHAGGSTEWIQNQNRDGYTWKNIGRYYFEAGTDASAASVVVSNESSAGGNVYADAVRFGGGMGQMIDPDSGGTSGKPQFEESGLYYAGFMGKSDWASYGTVSAMPSYAAWESEGWEDSIYVSLHTNAGGSRGTLGIAYGSCWDCWDDNNFAGVPGSRELRDLIVDELVNDIRVAEDPSWRFIYPISRAYGELSTSRNDEMPATIIEVGFHDDPQDAAYLNDPDFRRLTGRAIYQGIARYFADRDSTPAALLPEPPTHFRARNNGSGGIELSWNAPPSESGDDLLGDPATGYRVYTSTHGKGFADGEAVAGTSHTISSGLTAGETYFFRVSATNAGGESFPTETLAVRYQPSEANPILIVSGFDRMDREMSVMQGGAHRHFLDRMNTYDYAVMAAKDIEDYDQYSDSASNEAVENGAINLSSYAAIIWLLGEEDADNETFSALEQSAVANYLNAGGQLFVSGSEIAADLNGGSFLGSTLKASYAANDAGTYAATGSGGIFSDSGAVAFDNGSSIYNVEQPDRISPAGGSTAVMTYTGGGSGTAAIQYDGDYKLVYMAFPYEAIVDPNVRRSVMDRVLGFFNFDGGIITVPDLIIESRDPSGGLTANPPYAEAGGWADSTAKSSAPGLLGNGSRFSSSSTPESDTVTAVPNIPRAGIYEVAVTWNTSSNATNVRYVVKHANGEDEYFLDQEPADAPNGGNNNQWITLGQYEFAAGQDEATGSLMLDESPVTGTVTGYNTGRVYSDGFRWRFIEEIDGYDGWPFGDFNNDRCTDVDDFLILLDNWQSEMEQGRMMDINAFLSLLDHWQQGDSCQ